MSIIEKIKYDKKQFGTKYLLFLAMKRIVKKSCIYTGIYLPLRRKQFKNMIQKDPVSYIENRYHKIVKRTLNLNNPVTYTEKLQWRKLYDNNPLYTLCADKVKVRKFIEELFNQSKLKDNILFFPHWYGIFDNPDAIDFQELPNKFVLKSNHASGQVIICKDKSELNITKTKRQLKKWINTNYYYIDAEKHYKDIKPKIICEELLDSNIIDYRLFCFEGEPYLIKVTQHNNRITGGGMTKLHFIRIGQKRILFGIDSMGA